MNSLLKTKIIKENKDVDDRLKVFGVTRSDLLHIVKTVVAARDESVENDPVNAPGLFAYIYGVRATRAVFRAKGWEKDTSNNIESVYSPERGIRIIYQNTNTAGDAEDPKAISGKGPAAGKMVECGNKSFYLFEEFAEEDRKVEEAFYKQTNAEVWFFCVSVNEGEVRAELSCPRSIDNGQFNGFAERIFIVRDNEFNDLSPLTRADDDIDSAPDFDVEITRKEN